MCFDGIIDGIGDALSSAGDFVSSNLGTIGTIAGAATGQPWLGALGSLGSGLLAGAGSYYGQLSANATNQDMAQQQMDFQERMRSTQYQTTVADLKKAGLNPMLAYTNGGAGTPSGAMAHVENAASAGINSALSAATVRANLDKIKAETDAADATAKNQTSQAAVNAVTVPKIVQDTQTSMASANNLASQSSLNSVLYNKALTEIDKIAADTGLSRTQTDLAQQQIFNAWQTGKKIEVDIGNTEANTRLQNLYYRLNELDLPQAVNWSNAQKTWWMEHVSPFLPDLLKGVNSSGAAYRNFGGPAK